MQKAQSETANNWEQRKLAETASEFIGGGTPSTSVNEFWTGEIPWIQS
jgi:type I restriction enzyme S subunit